MKLQKEEFDGRGPQSASFCLWVLLHESWRKISRTEFYVEWTRKWDGAGGHGLSEGLHVATFLRPPFLVQHVYTFPWTWSREFFLHLLTQFMEFCPPVQMTRNLNWYTSQNTRQIEKLKSESLFMRNMLHGCSWKGRFRGWEVLGVE